MKVSEFDGKIRIRLDLNSIWRPRRWAITPDSSCLPSTWQLFSTNKLLPGDLQLWPYRSNLKICIVLQIRSARPYSESALFRPGIRRDPESSGGSTRAPKPHVTLKNNNNKMHIILPKQEETVLIWMWPLVYGSFFVLIRKTFPLGTSLLCNDPSERHIQDKETCHADIPRKILTPPCGRAGI